MWMHFVHESDYIPAIHFRKSEIRISKSETKSNDQNSNAQNRSPYRDAFVSVIGFLNFGFVSSFEFRASDFFN